MKESTTTSEVCVSVCLLREVQYEVRGTEGESQSQTRMYDVSQGTRDQCAQCYCVEVSDCKKRRLAISGYGMCGLVDRGLGVGLELVAVQTERGFSRFWRVSGVSD